jgi:hypothetical protein
MPPTMEESTGELKLDAARVAKAAAAMIKLKCFILTISCYCLWEEKVGDPTAIQNLEGRAREKIRDSETEENELILD